VKRDAAFRRGFLEKLSKAALRGGDPSRELVTDLVSATVKNRWYRRTEDSNQEPGADGNRRDTSGANGAVVC
jgi:hypothetical protein